MKLKIVRTANLSRAEYEKYISQYLLPSKVLATKPRSDSPESEWCYGDQRNPLHNCWLVVVGDEEDVRRPPCEITFDNVIDRGGKRLDHHSLRNDLLTKKIFCIASLTGQMQGSKTNAVGLRGLVLLYDWFVRWRLSLGIKRNSSLKAHHFEDYKTKVVGAEVIELVPWNGRLDAMFELFHDGKLPFELLFLSKDRPVAWTEIADFLGVTSWSLTNSGSVRAELRDRLATFPLAKPQRKILDRALGTVRLRRFDEAKGLSLGSVEEAEPLTKGDVGLSNHFSIWMKLRWLSTQKILRHDSLDFDPFEPVNLRALAERLGSGKKRTRTLHPDDFMRLLKLCAKWIVSYAPHILKVTQVLRERIGFPDTSKHEPGFRRQLESELDKERPEGLPLISLLWTETRRSTRRTGVEHLPVGLALKYLQIAAAILIGCFSARRLNEVLSLKVGCISLRGNLMYLHTFIQKTFQEHLDIPVPEIVGRAVEMLESMSATTRDETRKPWLFLVAKRGFGKKSFITRTIERGFNEFVNFNQLAPPKGESEWNLASHQFRRGFAVFYYHGFELATIEGVSIFLGHYDPTMTETYINEILPGQIGKLRDELRARLLVDRNARKSSEYKEKQELLTRLEQIVSDFREARLEAYMLNCLKVHRGEEKPIGRGARKLLANVNKAREHALAFVRIQSRGNEPQESDASVVDQLKQQAYEHFLNPTPDRSGLCMADEDESADKSQRECFKLAQRKRRAFGEGEGVGSTHAEIARAFSSANACLKCVEGCFMRGNQAILAGKAQRIQNAVNRSASPEAASDAHALFLEYEANLQGAADAVAGLYP